MVTLSTEKPTDAIAALLQERQRYEQWLAALESRRATTPSHVYARVHTDYESRLAHVLDELGGRSAELRQVVDDLTERVTALQSEENTHRDQRAEAELRAAVGEYSPDQWREVSQGTEADIARVAARRAEAASELAQVQQLLNMATATARRPDSAATAGGSAPSAAVGAAATAKQAGADPGSPRASAGASDRGEAPTFDELAFLHSVVEPKAGHGGAGGRTGAADGPPARPSGPASAPAPRAKTPAAAAAAASAAAAAATAAATAAPARAAPPPSGRPATPADSRAAGTAGAEAAADAPRRVSTDSDGVPVFLRDVPSEQIKTLKCAECGNMNYPTEWYCERCGGELAAM
jgi:hypothetical protein